MKATTRRPVNVTVTIVSDDPPEFTMTSDRIPIKKGSGEEDVLAFNNWEGGQYEDGFDVTFELQDDTRKGYGFFFRDRVEPDPNDAMSVKMVNPNGHCPRRSSRWVGFVPTEVTRNSLKVENPNGHRQYFGFAFYFSLPREAEPSLVFDPVGDNQNGEPPRNIC